MEATVDMSTVKSSSFNGAAGTFQDADFCPKLIELYEVSPSQTFYRIDVTGRIGVGGTSVIDSARQLSLDREIAIKRLRRDKFTPENQSALIAESKLQAKLDHPNIVPIHMMGFDSAGNPILAMKKINGNSFHDHLQRFENQCVDSARIRDDLQVFIQVCHALEYAHSKSIIHRDIKSSNIMIGEFGEVYLLDWGLAIYLDQAGEYFPTAFCGTPNHAAPEMVHMMEALTPRTDIYLLGALLHEILVNRPIHAGEDALTVLSKAVRARSYHYDKEIDSRLAGICHRATELKQEDRFQSVADFRMEVEDYLERRSIRALMESTQRQLQSLKEESSIRNPNSYQIYRLGFQCQFGFEQVLSLDEGLEEARRGLIEALEIIIRLEISQKQFSLAEKLLSELKEISVSAAKYGELEKAYREAMEEHNRASEITTQIQYRLMEKIQELEKEKKG
jgi:eukaryotic-like serine/threonine-protein kinase